MAATNTHSVNNLKRALKISEQIQELQAELLSVLGTTGEPKAKRAYNKKSAGAAAPKKKRMMSPEAREKIAAAQRKRWAKQKKAKK